MEKKHHFGYAPLIFNIQRNFWSKTKYTAFQPLLHKRQAVSIDTNDSTTSSYWYVCCALDSECCCAYITMDMSVFQILSVAIAKGQLSQSVQSRLSCCQILGKIATKFEPFV